MSQINLGIFFNGAILSVDEHDTVFQCMCIMDDKIIALGPYEDVKAEINKEIANIKQKNEQYLLEEIDLKGKCIVPGFIDAHMHPGVYIYFKTQLDLSKIRSYEEFRKLLNEADRVRNDDEWIFGIDFMEDNMIDKSERKFPNKNDLDGMCKNPNRPIVVLRHDGHICACNSKVLNIIGLNKNNVKDLTPKGGDIKTDANGVPIGIFTEKATALALGPIPIPNIDRLKDATNEFSKELASFGITTIGGVLQLGDFGPGGKAGEMESALIKMIAKDVGFNLDFVFYFITDKPKKLKRLKKSFGKLNERPDQYSVGGLKLFADGSFGARTACMFEPYSDDPTISGFMVTPPERLYELSLEATELGFDVIIHAIGDKANREVVNIYHKVLKNVDRQEQSNSDEIRLRIEHASQLNEDIIKDCAESNINLVCQPAFINSEYDWLEGRLGPQRIKYTYPFKKILGAGIMLSGASDAPIESANVLEALQACVTRKGFVAEECIDIKDALRMFTYNSAYALNQQKIKGSLEEGKYANFIILDKNPYNTNVKEIEKIKILKTYFRGKEIYSQ